jgi:uncharacterized protein YacL (UPF0231 family)
MGLDKSYDSFIISLDTTSPDQLTLDYVVSCMFNEEVHRTNVKIQRVVMKAKGGEKGEVRVKKEDNVVMVAMQRDRLALRKDRLCQSILQREANLRTWI